MSLWLAYHLWNRGLCPERLYLWIVDRHFRRVRPTMGLAVVDSETAAPLIDEARQAIARVRAMSVERGRAEEADRDQ